MASLKYNGTELARQVFERTDSDGVKHTHHLSYGSRGWILRRMDVVYLTGQRVKGTWKRWRKFDASQVEDDARDVADLWRGTYKRQGWKELQPTG